MGSSTRSTGTLAAIAVLLLALVPTPSWAQTAPAVPGRLAGSSPNDGDGIKVLLRYVNSDRFYAVHVNRRDGGMRIQRKDGPTYHALEAGQPAPFTPAYGQRQQVRVSVADRSDGSVAFRLTIDGQVVHTAEDAGQTSAGTPIRSGGSVGLRGDNTEFELGHLDVHRADADGNPTGSAVLRDRFDHPDGLITNQRIQSTQHPLWRVYSGSLFARDGRAWSGVPDDVRPDPESRWSSNSSTFRMLSHRDDLTDVVLSFELTNHGYVTPSVLPEIAPPTPPPYPTGTGSVAATRLDGSNHVQVAISASRRAFSGGASQAVLVSTGLEASSVAGPALAGAVDGPLLLTPSSGLNSETASELRRLGVRTVHLVGTLSSAVSRQLRDGGFQVRTYDGSSAEARTAEVALRVGGRHLYLATSSTWQDAVAVSGSAAATRTPVVLTPADRLGSSAARVLADNDVARVTVIGSDLDPAVVTQLRADGVRVDHAGHRRYAIARSSADAQLAAGGSAAALWVAAGQRPLHSLAGGPAAARGGGVLLVVDGNDLGDTSLEDLGYQGYESRHWARTHRARFSRLLALGPSDAVSGRVLDQLREEVVTIVAGMRDIAGNAHEASIVSLLERGIAGGYGDGTYRPEQAVTRGQMATFVTNAFELPPGSTELTDVAGTAHAAGIGAVTSAGVASGYPDGTFRPGQPVTRGQMATFLSNALELPPTTAAFPDSVGSPHEGGIGAVAEAGIARGFPDGTFRPTDPVTRAQMATFLVNALTAGQ